MVNKPKKTAKGKAPAPRRSGVGRWLRRFLVLSVWGFVALLGVVAFYAYDLPDVDNLGERTRTPSVRLVSADGVQIARFGDAYATPVHVADLPDHVRFAVLATEDRRFYSHFGLDVIALARATLANLRAGRVVQGASTLTQQIAKNVFLTPERSFKRKIQELLLAFWLEHTFAKDQLLSIYLNRVYLGAGTYGIGAASARYFGKPATKLSLGEAAMIAGLLKAPSRYAPTRDLERAQARARQVLGFMVDAGYIEDAEAQAASRSPFTIRRQLTTSRGVRYFADWVFDRVSDYTGPGAADITVVTTLDLRMQKAAEAAVEWALAGEGAERQATQAALVALAPDGAVRAMVGGRDYRLSQFNRATQARRQPGSAFKPFVYLAALEAGMKPGDKIDDAPLTIDGWSPRNYDGKYAGPVSLKEALVRSLNTVAVRIAERVGRDKVVDVARRLGISSPLRADASLALGASEATLLETTQAYTALANGGQGVWAHGIAEIRGAGGTVLYHRTGTGLGRVVEPQHLGPLVDMMSAVIDHGTGRTARVPWPSAGKTGTSQEWRDAWFIAFNRELTAGVWIGNDNGAPMKWVSGGGLPAQLWARFMGAALAGVAPRPLLTGPAK
jgi:penicillin-binding protein 1A